MPDDWHVHLRQGLMLDYVVEFSGRQFLNNLVMPNIDPPVTDVKRAEKYLDQIFGHSRTLRQINTRLALYLTRDTTAQTLYSAKQRIIAAKYYPHGGTTNSGSGLSTPWDLQSGVLEAMTELDIVLCLHAEVTRDVQADELKRERDFMPHLYRLVENHPDLRIVVEHVSDRRMLDFILELDRPTRVAATITAHHPFLTIMDTKHDPHVRCMPTAKLAEDRDYLAQIILEADQHQQIFFGSDSAPHMIENKLGGAAGIWSSPAAIPVLWDHFDRMGNLRKWEAWEAFMCHNGAQFYGVEPVSSRRPTITLRREAWRMPEEYFGMKPWMGGKILDWQVEGMEWFTELGGPVE